MNTIKEVFINLKSQILEGCEDINALAIEYGLVEGYTCYFMVLDPDHQNFDESVSRLEMNYNMISAGYCDTQLGFIKDLGEVGRLGFFQDAIEVDKIKEILQDVLFDIIKVN